MKKRSCRLILILALIISALMLGSIPAFADTPTSSYTAVVNKATAVYADAGCTGVAGSLNIYDVVVVTGINDTIARVRYKGYTLYMDLSALTAASDIAIPAKVTTTTFVFEDASITSRSLNLRAGLQVNVLATSGQWAMIEYNGYIGYTYKGYLEAIPTADTASESDTQSTVTTSGSPTVVNGVIVETVAASVSVSSLPVYKNASTRSTKLGSIPYGTNVTVYAYNSSWAYIGLGGKYGFCALQGLKKTSVVVVPAATADPNAAVNASTSQKATVAVSSLPVYASASTSSQKLGTLNYGLEVNVIKTSSKWAYIELGGRYGFCALDALKSSESVETPSSTTSSEIVINGLSPIGTCTVVTSTAPVYSSLSSSSHKTVPMGTTYDFYKYNSSWVAVGIDGKAAFIPIQYLSADNFAELKKDDSGSSVTTLNRALLSLGYLDDVVTSSFSAETELAVKRVQAACNLKETGVADLALLRILYRGTAPTSPLLNTTLSSGSKGDNVTRIQKRLYALGYLSRSSSIDGSYGTTTASAVKLFQSVAGGSASGTANSATLAALYHPAAPSLPSSADAADAQTSVATSSGSTTTTTQVSGSLTSTTSSYSSSMSNAQKLEYVIYNAQQQLGKRYVYGSTGMATFDCSGLTMYAFKTIGISLPHSAYSQGYNNNLPKITTGSALRRGDLIFFNTVSDSDLCDHVGIYLGNYYFIHASSGAGKVVVSNVSSGYYNRVFSWGRRVLA